MLQILKNWRKTDMKVTLQVNGRKMTFEEEDVIAIVEKHLSSETTKQTTKVSQKRLRMHGLRLNLRLLTRNSLKRRGKTAGRKQRDCLFLKHLLK